MVDALKLKLKTLPFGTHTVECHLDESFFNLDEQSEVRHADVDVPCDRCLDDLDLPVEVDYSLNVEQLGNEVDDSNDDLLIVPSHWRELDAAPLVRDTVLLALPMTRAHEDQRDCNAAMLDLLDSHRVEAVPDDDDDQQSETTGTDPRWEALKKLKQQ